MSEHEEVSNAHGCQKKEYQSPGIKVYTAPKLTNYGDLKDISKGQAAYSLNEDYGEDFAIS